MRLGDVYTPVKFQYAKKYFDNDRIQILDIGCGNKSPSLTKRWFPRSIYHGADIQKYKLDDSDFDAMDKFYTVGPDGKDGYEKINDSAYDFIILNHVIEHIHDQEAAVQTACRKLKPGGLIWLAFPSPNSLNFPSALGTLNFCDDPTHVRVCDVMGISNILLDCGLKIIKGGRSRDFVRLCAALLVFPAAMLSRLLTGKIQYRGLWYLYGFEDRVLAYKPERKS